MARDYSDVPDLETARRLLVAYDETTRKCAAEIERLRERVKELATALEFEANYDGHKLLARSALQQKESE